MNGVRMDKWLWAARFFRTRALAVKACELGRIEAGGVRAKAAREVKVGDMLHIRNEGGDFVVEVLELSDVRGPASVAQALYRETGESRELRARAAAERQQLMMSAAITEGRPSKKDRREINKLRGRIHRFGEG